jgi:TRAP-type C4-dicarboxylate transport system permease small subunit
MDRILTSVDGWLGRIDKLFLLLAGLLLIAMLAGNAANIASRNLFGVAILFVFPWTIVFFVWGSFLCFFVTKLVTLGVTGVLIWQAPGVLALQVGPISELVDIERYLLSIPLFVSSFLIFTDTLVDILRGSPERH